jgi:aspartate-semialdehyde dehydrogenase
MTVATYQAVSGTGREAVEELNEQTDRVLTRQGGDASPLPAPDRL